MVLLHSQTFFLDNFALRQWHDLAFAGTRLAHVDKQQFMDKVQAAFDAGRPLADGYAPFCKHIFLPNEWSGIPVGALPITDGNRHLLQSGYTRRRPEELAVLTRWFPAGTVQPTEAKWLDVILYSREQLNKEYEAMPSKEGAGDLLPDSPWGIISIKAQDEDYETPMAPITMMRNALGREEGGSGMPLDRAAYEAACSYWAAHAQIL
ncbi:flagellar associated [Micractinium conductrix]|uniref:Flagellar associated n=1 Tax=Micractinium conductrix TaxID=554055 RepID=A0A2P6V2E1_9CHLO|nr:flagellar associated [Micractinium conductrix]|eukprot:PSC68259.1 flagellar associated [Micractinium conductrix]